MTQYALEVHNLTKKIGKKLIVENVTFQIEKGEIFGLLGPNGAGKTTIIRMIVHLINRTEGKVMINGYDLDQSFKEALGEIGAIVENPEFYKYMSGMKNLKHYMRMATKDVSVERLEEVIRLVGLEQAIHQKVRTYSLGMRQRLGVAQALLHSPSILILDEPTNGLDPQGIREFRDYLRLLVNQGISVLVSSHLLSEMELMCDRFAIIEKGRLTHISRMDETVQLGSQTKQHVMFEVDNAEQAFNLLVNQNLGEGWNIEAGFIYASMDRETVAKANQLFVSNGLQVYEISYLKASLEDRFLEITNKEKKEQSI
ncbi:ABC transporter ATP-binding protein [Robertmurraya korlensis]|uniref:ABC transporter ATP-binding protein n=1 Tax=Robertmurraya korlensis TaxID=519977 RepID=UPI00203DD9CE|nr:ABC transporter ATP-binding protein [Robertmurraya korlensis]MCM3601511.1 ABC transporter ATP-binding protein [Robertmurraya korlensis]